MMLSKTIRSWVEKIVSRYPGSQSSVVRAVVGNTGWLFFDKGVGFLVTLLVWATVARYLGPAGLGTYSLATAIAGQLLVFATLGSDQILVRELAKQADNAGMLSGTALGLRFLGAILTAILVYPTAWLLTGGDQVVIVCTILAVVAGIVQAVNLPASWFQAHLQSKYSVLAGYAGTGIYIVGSFVMVSIGAPISAFFGVAIARMLVTVLTAFFIFEKKTGALHTFRWDRATAKMMLTDGWPSLVMSVPIMIYMRFDQIILAQFRGLEELGQYSVAVRIGELFGFIAGAVCASALPVLIQVRVSAPKLYNLRLIALFRALSLSGFIVCLLTTLSAPWIVWLIYGPQFSDAVPILRVYVWSTFFTFLNVGASQWFLAENKMTTLLLVSAFGAATSILANLVLVPVYGAFGSAWASVLAYSVSGCFVNAVIPSARPLFVLQLKSLLPNRVIDVLVRRSWIPRM